MSDDTCQPPVHRFGRGMRQCKCGAVTVPEAGNRRIEQSAQRGRAKGFTLESRSMGGRATRRRPPR